MGNTRWQVGSNPGVERKAELEKPELISMQEHGTMSIVI
jgi:hypothetical protein